MDTTNFITADELKSVTAISQNTDVNLLTPFITVSEQIHIVPIIGLALTTELQTQIDTVTLTALNEKLLNDYIIPLACWLTFFEASPFLLFRTNNKGLTKNYSETSQPLDRFELSIYKQAINDKCSFYRKQLVDYLNLNKVSYPLYRPDHITTTHQTNSTGFFLG